MPGRDAPDFANGATAFLNCPRCGLSIRARGPWPGMEYCPRCLAREWPPVTLFVSTLPASELYPDGAGPGPQAGSGDAGQRG